jgi:hypothetical protein
VYIYKVYKKVYKTGCYNCQDISLLSAAYIILCSIVLSRLIPYVDKFIECGFQCNRSTTDHIFCFCQVLEKTWEYCGAVNQYNLVVMITRNTAG